MKTLTRAQKLSAAATKSWQDPKYRMKQLTKFGTAEERFWQRVTKTDLCWLYSASSHRRGYGHIYVEGKREYAHRFAYKLMVGEIPMGHVVHHECGNTACVNPAHLRAVTVRENNLAGEGPTLVRNLKARIVALEEENANLKSQLSEYLI